MDVLVVVASWIEDGIPEVEVLGIFESKIEAIECVQDNMEDWGPNIIVQSISF